MAENSKIQWTHNTYNYWRGCAKVSPGCKYCYAEAQAKRNPKVLGIWGENGVRAFASESYKKKPFEWDKKAKEAGERHRIFCASLADVFEKRDDLVEPRKELFEIIRNTPNLDWLLLSKRPENIEDMLPDDWGNGWDNVWLGTSVENQAMADLRIPILLKIPARIRFLSCEPLIGPVNIEKWIGESECLAREDVTHCVHWWDGTEPCCACGNHSIDWVIAGGESGPNARECAEEWIESLTKQCKEGGVALFNKQMGENATRNGQSVIYIHKKGGDPEEWPELDIRQFPEFDYK
jgi:protein gp37